MASSLILHKRIQTTVAKAKALRKYVEPLLTKAKTDSTHSRRVVFSYLQNKETVQTLFNEVADRIADRPGGYTRIIKTGSRLGDNAEMCFIELVDYNELMLKDAKPAKAKTRRGRKGGKTKETTSEAAAHPAEVKVSIETTEDKVAEVKEETVKVSEEVSGTEETSTSTTEEEEQTEEETKTDEATEEQTDTETTKTTVEVGDDTVEETETVNDKAEEVTEAEAADEKEGTESIDDQVDETAEGDQAPGKEKSSGDTDEIKPDQEKEEK